jgi:hypothetical protein
MLLVEADIRFNTPEESEYSLPWDLNPKLILRPAINLGGYLSSGTIIADTNTDKLIRGQTYRVLIELPLIFGEAYDDVRDVLKDGYIFDINDGSHKVGAGQIVGFVYEREKGEE